MKTLENIKTRRWRSCLAGELCGLIVGSDTGNVEKRRNSAGFCECIALRGGYALLSGFSCFAGVRTS